MSPRVPTLSKRDPGWTNFQEPTLQTTRISQCKGRVRGGFWILRASELASGMAGCETHVRRTPQGVSCQKIATPEGPSWIAYGLSCAGQGRPVEQGHVKR